MQQDFPRGEMPHTARAEARRAQVLDAALACFREHGFHGASIARICKASGMSPGHIYHYFRNKEEIIAAIVEQDVARILDFHDRMRSSDDLVATMRECVAEGVRDTLDADAAALKLEILAEAARNPRIAELVQAADRRLRTSFIETLRAVGVVRGDDAQMNDCVDTLCAMFDGLMTRGVRNPDLDVAAVTRRYQERVLELLGITA
ncbi:TetR/AcrR family transcriptional regulator [Pseudazoarcus pumilus]|nr:TetR family transcriptional regulator [Pseudazoarcus pumilus]